jgi:ABC-type uncharacterized transport system permease subunit
VVVAMLGGLTMPGVLLASLLLGDLSVGASSAVRSLQIPSQIGDVVQGTLLLVVVGALAVYRWRTTREDDRPPDEGEPEPEEPPHRPRGAAPVEEPPR